MTRLGILSLLALVMLLLGEEIADAQQKMIDLPDTVPAAFERGRAYIQGGKYHKARITAENALRANPSSPDLHELLGHACLGLRDYPRAKEEYTQAIRHGSCSYLVYNNRGGLYAARKEWGPAIKDYSKAIKIDPAFPDAYYNRARIYRRQRQYAKARRDYEEADKRGCGNIATASLVWLMATCPEGAVRDGRKAIEYARTLCERTEYKEPAFLEALAAAHAEAGQWKEAVHQTEQALELAETRKYARENCEGIKMRLELYQLHEPYRTFPPDTPSGQRFSSAVEALLYGVAKMGVGDYEGAIPDLQKAVKLNPRLRSARHCLEYSLTQKEKERR